MEVKRNKRILTCQLYSVFTKANINNLHDSCVKLAWWGTENIFFYINLAITNLLKDISQLPAVSIQKGHVYDGKSMEYNS